MWGNSILADFRPIGYISFHAAVVFGLGKDFLFKSTLGHSERRLEAKDVRNIEN